MSDQTKSETNVEARRALLKRAGRFVAVSVPAVTLLLAASSKPAWAVPVSII
jgi:hypothetical protein